MTDISALQKAIEQFAYSNGKDTKQVMSDLLKFIIGNFNPQPEPIQHWNYTKEQNKEFHNMMLLWLQVMQSALETREWYDPWGDLFMALTPKGGARGQFFTPTDICDMMADICDPATAEPTRVCGAFGKRVTVSDCACGSGRNLLAAHAKFIEAKARKPYLVAEDIDLDCCRMTAVNMMAHGCFGEVICHNTLTQPKQLVVGYLINESMYPIPCPLPSIRIKREPEWFVSLR